MRWISLGLLTTLIAGTTCSAGLFDHFFTRTTIASSGCKTQLCTSEPCTKECGTPQFTYQRNRSAIPALCTTGCCTDGCDKGDSCTTEGASTRCCNPVCTDSTCHSQARCCEIAKLIHESMTACYAKQRYDAVHHLSDYYDCCCHPEIMTALVHALNDSHEKVRAKAADEIGDQIRRNRCVIGPMVVTALQGSLRDCDHDVRRQAQEALSWAGARAVMPCRAVGQTCPPRPTEKAEDSKTSDDSAESPPPLDAVPVPENSNSAEADPGSKDDSAAEPEAVPPVAAPGLTGPVPAPVGTEQAAEVLPPIDEQGQLLPPVESLAEDEGDVPRIPRPNLAELLVEDPAKQ